MIKINISTLEYILKITPSEQNIMLVGRHGIGKSKILESYFTRQGLKVVTLFLGQMSDPGDLIGLPEKDSEHGQTNFLLPYWFPKDDKPIVLFLDELNRARPEVLQTIMDLALNRKLAGKSLPEGSRIISAVNDGEQYTLTELDPALVSRFNVYEFVPSEAEWLSWAEKNGIDQRIIDFISENKTLLDGTEFDKSIMGLERTPDRRSWERLSNILKNMESIGKTELSVISGIIGMAAATKFFEYVTESKILTAQKVLLASNFTPLEKKLKTYKLPELAVINEGIFRFLNSELYASTDEDKINKNLCSYYHFIDRNKEALGHFANLFSSASYPNAAVFIATKCKEIYSGLRKFITEIGE